MSAALLTRRPFVLGLAAFSASSILLAPLFTRQRLSCDAGPVSAKDWSISQYQRDARTPIVKSGGGGLNPAAVRQISAGSITGVVVGLGISTFSKPLALLLGLLLAGVTFLESRGIRVVPYKRLQGLVQGVDIRSLVQDNAAFKLSFGLTCALVGFAEF